MTVSVLTGLKSYSIALQEMEKAAPISETPKLKDRVKQAVVEQLPCLGRIKFLNYQASKTLIDNLYGSVLKSKLVSEGVFTIKPLHERYFALAESIDTRYAMLKSSDPLKIDNLFHKGQRQLLEKTYTKAEALKISEAISRVMERVQSDILYAEKQVQQMHGQAKAKMDALINVSCDISQIRRHVKQVTEEANLRIHLLNTIQNCITTLRSDCDTFFRRPSATAEARISEDLKALQSQLAKFSNVRGFMMFKDTCKQLVPILAMFSEIR